MFRVQYGLYRVVFDAGWYMCLTLGVNVALHFGLKGHTVYCKSALRVL